MPTIEFMESLLLTLWRMSWQASILVLLVLLAQGLMRHRLSPTWRSALWLLVVARLLLPITPSSPWSLFHLTDRVVARVNSTSDTTTAFIAPSTGVEPPVDWAEPLDNQAWLPPLSMWESRPQSPPLLSPPAWTVPALEPVPSPTTSFTRRAVPWTPILFWTWLTGVVLLGARLGWGAAAFYRGIRRLPPVRDPRVLTLLEECRAIMGTRVSITLIETDTVDSPALFGFLRLRLLLPTGVVRRLSNDDLRHLFLHELAHVRRGDVPLNWLTSALQVVHWFNPVVWLAFARMRADRELACDAMALDRNGSVDRAAYGATVLKLVSGLKSARPAPGLVGISEGKSNLKRRIRMIASHRSSRRWSVWAALILLTLGLVSLTDAREAVEIEEQEEASASEVGSEPELAPTTQERDTEARDPADRPEVPQTDDSSSGPAQRRWPFSDLPFIPLPRDAEAADAVAEANGDADQAAWHVDIGRLLYQMGRFPEAEAALRRAFQFDPGNEVAHHYWKLISERRRQAVREQLRKIILPEVMFDGLALSEVLDFLNREAIQHDPERHGVPLILFHHMISGDTGPVESDLDGPDHPGLDWGSARLGSVQVLDPIVFSDSQDPAPYRTLAGLRLFFDGNPGVRALAGPRVTTLSGRQTLINLGLPGDVSFELDCLPVVQPNGQDIGLAMRIRAGHAEEDASATTPELREFVTSGIVPLGRSVLLTFLDDGEIPAGDDPVLGALPPGVRDARVDAPVPRGRRLLLLVTPTMIDPAGNPVQVIEQPSPGTDNSILGRLTARGITDERETMDRLHRALTQASEARERGEILSATRLYEEAHRWAALLGPDARVEAREAVGGVVELRLELARHALRRGDHGQARRHLDRVLALARTNEEASRLKLEGFIKPEPKLPREGSSAESGSQDQARRAQIQTHVRNGRVLYEVGKLPEAEAELRRALGLDLENRAARDYLKLVAAAQQADAIRRKLPEIVLREVMFDGVPLPDVLEYLQNEIGGRDVTNAGVSFRIEPASAPWMIEWHFDSVTGEEIPATPVERINLHKVAVRFDAPYRNVRLSDLLEAIVRSADKPIRFFADESGVVFDQAPPGRSQRLETRVFRVNIGRFLENEDQARELFASAEFNLHPPHHLHLNTRTGNPDCAGQER